jgi:hypothetical protein
MCNAAVLAPQPGGSRRNFRVHDLWDSCRPPRQRPARCTVPYVRVTRLLAARAQDCGEPIRENWVDASIAMVPSPGAGPGMAKAKRHQPKSERFARQDDWPLPFGLRSGSVGRGCHLASREAPPLRPARRRLTFIGRERSWCWNTLVLAFTISSLFDDSRSLSETHRFNGITDTLSSFGCSVKPCGKCDQTDVLGQLCSAGCLGWVCSQALR